MILDAKSEVPIFSLGPWKMQSLSGSIIAEGIYRQQNNELNSGFSDQMHSTAFRGLFRLNTNSYIWHPNFLSLDAGFEFSPDAHKDNYLVIPDRSETNTAEKINLQATFLSKAPIVLSLSGNLGHLYSSRDIATDIEYYSQSYGALLQVRNSFLPFSLGYNYSKWQDKELKTGRVFAYNSKNFSVQAEKSFSDYFVNQFNYNFEDVNTDYTGNSSLRSKINNFNLNSRIIFTEDGYNSFNSNIAYSDIDGYQRLRRWDAHEALAIRLPEDFKLRMDYQYFNQIINDGSLITHNPFIQLEHQLYKSLRSYTYFRYSEARNIAFVEKRDIWGLGFNYQKMIPTGMLNLNYEFRYADESRNTSPSQLKIENEEYTLDDSKIVLIKNAFVRPESIIIKNANNTIIYQKDLDYIIIPRGDFIEIKRVPGGRIANNDLIFIDYLTGLQNSYNFTSLSHTIDGRINLFERFLEVYFRILDNNFRNVNVDSFRVMKTIDQKVVGFQININEFSGGIQWDQYNTNIIPYQSYSFFIRYTDNITNDMTLSMLANYQKYKFSTIDEQQDYADLSSKLGYRINSWSSVNMEGGYRLQSGNGIDLNILNLRAEYIAVFYQVTLTIGIEAYHRDFMSEINDYKGVFVRVERRF